MLGIRVRTKLACTVMSAVIAAGLAPPVQAQSSGQSGSDESDSNRQTLEEIIVSATRTSRSDKTIPNQVSIIDKEQLDLQLTITATTADLLSNMLPSFSPPRQKLDGQGESFRGRAPLYLIDGVPQSNPLRNGSRDGFTLDMGVVQKVEVIHGANAIQGLGATGGIINFITVSPPDSGELMQRVQLGLTTDDGFHGNGMGYRGQYLVGQDFGDVDAVASVSYETRGMYYDGDGNLVGIEATQGDVADSQARDVFFKVGYEPSENQRLQLMVNDFKLDGNGDYYDVDGDRAAGIPTTSAKGTYPGEPYLNDVTTISLNYANTDFLGGRLTGQTFYQDFAGVYGGGTFGVFQDPAIAPIGELFDQSENDSTKSGLRLTQGYTGLASGKLGLIFGIDFLKDETKQVLIHTGRNWVPQTTFNNVAPFIQLDLDVAPWLKVVGGARFESAELDVSTYTTLAGNRGSTDYQPVEVSGGKPDFTETMTNFGFIVRPSDQVSIYGTYSEGFGMPDVGRVLRGVSEPGTDVDTLLNLAPLVTDNKEVGIEYSPDWGSMKLSWYRSSSDFGERLVTNEDGIFDVNRDKTVVTGLEASVSGQLADWLELSVAYSDLTGEFDSDDNGHVDSDLGAINVAPDRLNVSLSFNPDGQWSGRLQSFTYFDKTFRDADNAVTAQFDGYTDVDALAMTTVGSTRLTFGIANLLDKEYITYYGQAGNTRADRYFAGKGRTLTVRADFNF